jgi:hypothetical protein
MLRPNRTDSPVGQKTMSSRNRLSYVAFSALSALSVVACVDPQKTFDEFEDRVVDAAPREGGCTPAGFFPIEGEFLLAIQTPIGGPLRIIVSGSTTANEAGGTADFTFQPIIDDECVPGQGGQPAGEPLPPIEGLTIEADGTFALTQTAATTPGDANPITCGDILADISFSGCTTSETTFCGDVTGMVMEPIPLDLAGSTFGAVQIETGARGDANLPEPVNACE